MGEGVGETQLTFCGLELDVICLGGSLWPRTPLVNRKTRISCTRWQPRETFFCCSLGGRMATTRRRKLRLSLCVRNVACAHAPHHACAPRAGKVCEVSILRVGGAGGIFFLFQREDEEREHIQSLPSPPT